MPAVTRPAPNAGTRVTVTGIVISTHTATVQASPKITFIKYWGNRDNSPCLPLNGPISMNLDGLFTRTSVSFQPLLGFDEFIINCHEMMGKSLERVSPIL